MNRSQKIPQFFNITLFLSFLLLVFSCTQKTAQIINKAEKSKANATFQSKIYNEKNSKIAETSLATTKDSEATLISQSLLKPVKTSYQNLQPKPLESVYQQYQITIKEGDTLYSISKKHSVPLKDLIEYNNLSSPFNLKLGTMLLLPKPNYHIVQSGDTIYSISRMHKMSINNLYELNDLSPNSGIKVGQKIRVYKNNNSDYADAGLKNASSVKEGQILTEDNKQKGTKYSENKAIDDKKNLLEKPLDKIPNFLWPALGEVVLKFGPKSQGMHSDGITIKLPSSVVVKASEDGVVAYVGNEIKGYGNLAIIKHANGWITAYGHLSNIKVKVGQKVKRAEIISESSSETSGKASQLYFSIRKGRDAVNPENYLVKS